MSIQVLARRLIFGGTGISVSGIILSLLYTPVLKASRSFRVADDNAILSLAMTLFGLLMAMVGGVLWACVAPFSYLLPWGVSIGVAALLLVKLLDVNLLGSTAILIPAFYVTEFTSIVILLIAAVRFGLSRWKRQT